MSLGINYIYAYQTEISYMSLLVFGNFHKIILIRQNHMDDPTQKPNNP